MADTDPDDRRAEALAESLRNACADYPNHVVLFELVGILGECIGRFPPHEHSSVLNLLEVELRHYVSQIPPLASDDHAA